jgi:RNA polymerase sigma-70 factor (ECF subfamily)
MTQGIAMLQDRLLIWRFKQGSGEALARIYDKYVVLLTTLACSLLNDSAAGEDVVHDVFVSFAQTADRLRLDGSLKAYLSTCVVNKARDRLRSRKRQPASLGASVLVQDVGRTPEQIASVREDQERIDAALAQLPVPQRETLLLRLQARMTFHEIAKSQDVSINTVQSRYRYGMDKLRHLLNGDHRS